MSDVKDLLDLLQNFEKEWEAQQERRPFHLNVLDYCRTYENAHTQILLKILHYKENTEYPLIESFLRNVGIDIHWNHANTRIEFNKDFIDGYLCDGVNAIIIENKINNAVDQDNQIKSYVNKVKDVRLFNFENIYVLYLTRDGSKQVSQSSCSNKLKYDLGKRFIEINYRNDILPWLKNDVLFNCNEKNEIFISALKQYIDYLEGILMLRKGDEGMDKEIINWLKKIISYEEGSWIHHERLLKKISILPRLNGYLDQILHEVKNSVVSITQEYWNKEYDVENSIGDGVYSDWQFLYFGNPKWNKKNDLLIHLEWHPITERILFERKTMTMHLHFERNVQDYINYLEKDSNFLAIINAVGMTAVSTNDSNIKLNYQKTIEFEKPLAQMAEDERKTILFKEYDKVKPLLDYVYRKCEQCDSNS